MANRKFKTDSQRKAAMARMRARKQFVDDISFMGQNKKTLKNKSYSQLANSGIRLRYTGDADKDGVINGKDCKPFDPKKQGLLHKLTIKRLKAQEEKFERQRQKEQNKLNDLTEELRARSKLSSKKTKLKQTELRQKQVVIDELNKEKAKLSKVKKANEAAQKELDKFTLKGKAKRVSAQVVNSTFDKSKKALEAAEHRWNLPANVQHRKKMKKSAVKGLKKIGKQIFG